MADRSIPHSPPPNPTDPEQTFGNSKANLQIGVQSNQTNSFQDIGFGYVGAALQHKPPAVIAYEQMSAAEKLQWEQESTELQPQPVP